MKQMKRISMPNNKSVRKFAECIEPKYEKEFRIHNAFSSMKKKKPVHATVRIYFSNFFLKKKIIKKKLLQFLEIKILAFMKIGKQIFMNLIMMKMLRLMMNKKKLRKIFR